MLTVELKDALNLTRCEVEIFCDKEGLELLFKNLENLRLRGGHVHLMTPSWSGKELTEEKQRPSNTLINHLCIFLKPPE
jgi:hypothetical protein